jgi:hypothetical protein
MIEPEREELMTSSKSPDANTGHEITAIGPRVGQGEVPLEGVRQAETFRDVALSVRENGFVIMPVDGKAAFVKNFSTLWLLDQSASTIGKWIKAHGGNNTGLCLGEVVAIDIDIDDHTLANDVHSFVEAQLGASPFVRFGRQPRRVLLYRVDRLWAEHLLKGWSVGSTQTGKVELLGPGKQVVIFGTHPDTGTAYFWPQKSPLIATIDEVPWIDFEELEAFKEKLDEHLRQTPKVAKAPAPSEPSAPTTGGDAPVSAKWSLDYLPKEGERANFIYWYAREKAAEYETEGELAKDMIAKNATFSKPLTEAEVRATTRSTWQQKIEGRLMRSGKNAPAVLPTRRDTLAALVPDLSPHACKLYLLLVATRDNRKNFAIAQHATANHLNMGKPTLVEAIKALIAIGLIERVGEKQKAKGTPWKRNATAYRFL